MGNGFENKVLGYLAQLTQEMTGIKTDVSGLKEDVSVLKADVATLKTDVSGLKEDMSGVKKSMARIDKELSGVKQSIVRIENEQSEKFTALFDGYKSNSEQLNRIEDKVDNLITIVTRHDVAIDILKKAK